MELPLETIIVDEIVENEITKNLIGSDETLERLYQKLDSDIKIHQTRPFLDKQEKHDFSLYYNYWATNKIIGLLNFDTDGNFLPDVYSAPIDIQNMLYPISDIIGFEKQGTLIIDREQYTPELRKLSFLIYMVDAELYEDYKSKQNFRGESAPTYMYDKKENNGVRIFKSYYEMARHLARKRYISYCIGPRAIFYLRWFIHELHEHTVQSEYAYGSKVKHSYARHILNVVKRHMAFNVHHSLEYKYEVTVDNYQNYRKLAKKFRMLLPNVENYKSTTMINRYSKQTMHSKVLAKIKKNKIEHYQETLGIQPWHHLLVTETHFVAYLWDSRLVELVIPIDMIEQGDISYNVIDNRNDLIVKDTSPTNVKQFLEEHKLDIPVQFRYPDNNEFDGSETWFWKNNVDKK